MMKLYPSWFIFMSMNLIGLLIIISSNNWLMTWMGFELSLMGFLPMFLVNKLAIEGMVKYLLIQAGGSSMLMLSFLSNMSNVSMTFIMISMLLKIGMFPFLQWVPMIMATLNWMGCFLLSTIQKLGPMFILMKINLMSMTPILISSSMSVLMSGMMGMNQTLMRPLLGYSSISHTSWIVASIPFNQHLTITYILIYFWMSLILFTSLKKMNLHSVVSSGVEKKEMIKINVSLLVLSGMPPFSIFFLKMMIFCSLIKHILILMIMMMGAMMSTYFYLTFIIPALSKSLTKQFSKVNMKMYSSFIIPMMILPLITTI